VRIFGIDPGSERTGYGCVESDGRRHRLVCCGAITASSHDSFPERLARIYRELSKLLASSQPDFVAVENLFHAANVRSALKLGHARGVAMLAAIEAGCELAEYTPAEVKRAVVGYGRAEKGQVQQMVKLLLGLHTPPSPHDAADALAVAICHLHTKRTEVRLTTSAKATVVKKPAEVRLKPDTTTKGRAPRTWRDYRPPAAG
jgi:crossover junction endodeoxyribonuclease RuvC